MGHNALGHGCPTGHLTCTPDTLCPECRDAVVSEVFAGWIVLDLDRV